MVRSDLARDSIVLEEVLCVDPNNTLRIRIESRFTKGLVLLQFGVFDRYEPTLLIAIDIEPLQFPTLLVRIEKVSGHVGLARWGSNYVRKRNDIRLRDLIRSRGIGGDIMLMDVTYK